jgi:trimeric autotransporter adhesin
MKTPIPMGPTARVLSLLCLAVAMVACTQTTPGSATTPAGATNPATSTAATASPATTASVSAPPSGTGVAVALGISPQSQDYGNVAPGATAGPIEFTVTNNGGSATGVLASSLSGVNAAEFTIVLDNCSGVALAAAATCAVRVSFAPTSLGPKTASLHVGTADGSVSAALSGTGVAP